MQRANTARRMTLLGPFGPDMTQFSGRRRDGYPRPGHMFRRPGSNFRRQDPSQGRPFRRKNGESRRNQSSNKKQEEDLKESSAVRQEAETFVEDTGTRAVETVEWGVPDLSDSLFNQCKSVCDSIKIKYIHNISTDMYFPALINIMELQFFSDHLQPSLSLISMDQTLITSEYICFY